MTFVDSSSIRWNPNINNINNAIKTMPENNRKRSRDDDNCEFMPLSKRINNLHINNNVQHSNINAHTPESSHAGGINPNNVISSQNSSGSERRPSYDPGVNSSQSNYYFDNKLLFELHLERIQRTGQEHPF